MQIERGRKNRFKDLHTFNKAKLEKKSWRVMSDETYLLHKVYKARYFLDRTFMEAKLEK